VSEKELLAEGLATQLAASLAGIETRLVGIEKSVRQLDGAIRGNEEPGIKTTLALLGQELETLKDTVAANTAKRFNQGVLLWTCLATLAAAIIGSYVLVRMERTERITTQQSGQ